MATLKQIAQLDFNLLKVLEALYLNQNMTRAANQLNITPSAVSHAVKRLREVLDDPLFERRGHQMLPTPVCRRVVPEVLALLSELRARLQTFGDFDPGSANQTLRLAIHEAMEPMLFPVILSHMATQAPKLELHSVKLDRLQLPMQLESGQVDFAIDVARPLTAPIEHRLLSKTDFCVLRRSSVSGEGSVTLTEYQQAAHVTVSNRATGKVIEDVAFAQLGFNRHVRVRCQSYQTARQIIKGQSLLLTLPRFIADTLLDDQLVMAELPFSVPPVETHLYWHTNANGDALMSWVRETMFNALGGHSVN